MYDFIGRMTREGEGGGGGAVPPPVVPPPVPGAEAAHPITAPWGSTDTWQLGEAGKEQPWYAAIPEESVRESVKAKGYKNPAELAMAYHSLMSIQRNPDQTVMLPPADATPEQMNDFYAKLGRPEVADKYELKMPDGIEADPRMVDFAKKTSFELGLNPTQAQKLADKWNEFVPSLNAEVEAADAAANTQALGELETRWGPDLEANKAAGRRALDALGLDGALVDKVDAAIGTASVVELLAAIGKKSGEGPLITPTTPSGDPNDPAGMTKEQAQSRIAQLGADPVFQEKYTNKQHPEHDKAVKHMEALYAKS